MAATEAAWQCLSQSAIGQLSSDQLAAADLACKHLLKAVNRVEEDGSRMQNWPRPTPSVLAKLVVTKYVLKLGLIDFVT